MHYPEYWEWDVFMNTLRKIRNDWIAAELDEHTPDFDQALQRAEWRTIDRRLSTKGTTS
jgi:hypothetical protein